MTLRPLDRDDIAGLVRVCASREVAVMTATIPHPYAASDAEEFLSRLQGAWERGETACFGIVSGSGLLVGTIGLRIDHANLRAEVGYCIAIEDWGRGYATSALRTLIPFAFGPVGLRRLVAHAFPHNAASVRVLRKCGFREEGLLRKHELKWGVPTDLLALGLLRDESMLDCPISFA